MKWSISLKVFLLIIIAIIIFGAFLYYIRHNLPGMKQERLEYIEEGPGEVHIGVIWPLDDEHLSSYLHGVELALEEIKDDEAFPYRFVVHYADEKKREEAVWQFAQDERIIAVIGGYHSGDVKYWAPILDQAGILFLQSGTDPLLQWQHVRLMLEISCNDFYHARNLRKIIQHLEADRIVIIHASTIYGEELASFFVYEITKYTDVQILASVSYWENINFASIYNASTFLPFDLVVFIGYVEDAVEFLKYAKWAGYKKPFVANEVIDSPAFYQRFSPDELQDTYCSSYLNDFSSKHEKKTFAQKYQEKYGTPPDQWSVWGYAAVMLLKKAIERTGSLQPKVLYDTILYRELSVLGDTYRFSRNGLLLLDATVPKKWVPERGFEPFLTIEGGEELSIIEDLVEIEPYMVK